MLFSPVNLADTAVEAVPVSAPVLAVALVKVVLLVPQANQYCVVALLAVRLPFRVAPVAVMAVSALLVTAGAVAMVYVADATALFEYPVATAMASRVSVAETLMAPVYFVDEVVGVVPFVV